MKTQHLVVPFEMKQLASDDPVGSFEGYGSVFDTRDTFDDVVAKGAFKRSLKEWAAKDRMPAMLWQHDPADPVGVWEDMREDETGLFVKGQLADTQRGREAHTLLKMGALSGLSIGFRTRQSEQDKAGQVRTLTDVDLWEVSLVTFPALDPARVSAVKADGALPSERELEAWLRREGGFTEAQAKCIIAKGYRQVRREAMSSEEACEELVAIVRSLEHATALLTGAEHGPQRSEGGR